MIEKNKNQLVPRALLEKDWVSEMLNQFDHPSTVLWRAIEAKCVSNYVSKINLENKLILDLGCGEGKVSSIIFDGDLDIIGLDNSKEDIIKAKGRGNYRELILGDAQWLPFSDRSIDIVFSNSVLEHIPDIFMVLKGVSRILQKNGKLVFTVPDDQFGNYLFLYVLAERLGLKGFARWYSKRRNRLLNHFHCYSPKVWEYKLKEADLDMVYAKYYLSKSTIEVWDFLALCIFFMQIFMRKVPPRILNRLLDGTKNLRISFFRRTLRKYYTEICNIGGALIIVATTQ
jgi:ubiquinone/menaquinone biosynthesis C-methylase UbiE